MPIKFHASGSTSNKPQEPDPKPAESDFPTTLTLKDGRTVWVSLPQPDRLTIVGEIGDHTYSDMVPAGTAPAEVVKQLGNYLLTEPHNAHHSDSWLDPTKGYHRVVVLALGPRASPVRFEPIAPKGSHGWRLRLEMNPRKLGKAGMIQLAKVLGAKDGPFNLPSFAATCRVSRLDVAVDFVGIEVDDLLVNHKAQGKRSFYVGADGALETVLVHRKLIAPKQKYDLYGDEKKITHPAKPAGSVILKIYDRAREREAVLQPRPFGPAPVTRVEVTLTRLMTTLPALPLRANPFAKTTLGIWQEQGVAQDVLWGEYVAVRRSASPDQTKMRLGLSDTRASAFEGALTAPADTISLDEIWKGWKTTLSAGGFDAWVSP